LNACGRCKLALYCSISCQKSDYSGHKIMCLEFIRKPNTEADKIKKFLEENYQVKSFQGSDVVTRSMQMMMFNEEFPIKLSRFAEMKRNIIIGMYYCAVSYPVQKNPNLFCSIDSMERVLKEAMYTMTLCQPICTHIRFLIPLMMIHVERYDDAYNFIKFWLATADYRANHSTMELKENDFSLKNQDPTENILEFMKYAKCLVKDCLFYVYSIVIKMNTIKEMERSGNKSMIPRQEEHLEIYLQYIQKHCPGFLWNFVNFDCNEEDFIIPDKPKYRDCERMEAETLGIFAPPICTAIINNTPVKEKIKSFLLKAKCGPNRFNHGWKQIRTRGVAEKQEFTLKMYEKVWSRFNQGIM